jgi:hypothetical protein
MVLNHLLQESATKKIYQLNGKNHITIRLLETKNIIMRFMIILSPILPNGMKIETIRRILANKKARMNTGFYVGVVVKKSGGDEDVEMGVASMV